MAEEARTRYMLDANAFDYLLDRAIDPAAVRGLGELCITTVQHRELLDVPDPNRRRRLLGVLSAVDPTVRPAGADAWAHEIASSGGAARPDDVPVASGPRHGPSPLRGASRKPASWKDAAIGEVAGLEDCVLVTDDKGFRRRAIESGLAAMSCAEAFAGLDALGGVEGRGGGDAAVSRARRRPRRGASGARAPSRVRRRS